MPSLLRFITPSLISPRCFRMAVFRTSLWPLVCRLEWSDDGVGHGEGSFANCRSISSCSRQQLGRVSTNMARAPVEHSPCTCRAVENSYLVPPRFVSRRFFLSCYYSVECWFPELHLRPCRYCLRSPLQRCFCSYGRRLIHRGDGCDLRLSHIEQQQLYL